MNRKMLLFVSAACVLALLTIGLKQYLPKSVSKAEMNTNQEEQQDDPLAAELQDLNRTRDPKTGKVPRERLITAKEIMDQRFALQKAMRAVAGISWTERGPNNIGGRVRALIFDKTDPTRKVWAGGVSGGLWRCNDITLATPVWTRINDFFGNMAVTSIAQDPKNTNVIYFGTGEGWSNSDAVRGLGIWRSTDGGATFSRLAATANSSFYFVNKLAVDSGGFVYAATSTGLKKSTDFGVTWSTVLSTANGAPNNFIADIEITPDQVFYCGLGNVFTTGGVFKSVNRGSTWTNVTPAGNWRRTEIGVCESNFSRVYVMMQSGTSNGIGGIFRTDNAGTSWTTLPNPSWCDQGTTKTDFTRGQAWYDLIIGADPTNSNNVMIGGVDIFRSTNAGANWTQVSQWASGCGSLPVVHADIHAITYAPSTAGARVAIGCDGGVYLSNNNGLSYTAKNNGLNITQFYSVAIHPNSSTNPSYLLGGTQDNGSIRTNSTGIGSGTTVTGGDGGFAHIDQTNSNIQITSFTNNDYNVSTNGGSSFTRYFKNSNGGFINPTDYDNAKDVLYGGSSAGSIFRWINPAGNGPSINLNITNFSGANITHIQVSANGRDTIYCGLDNGNVVRLNNASSLNGGTLLSKIIRTGTAGASVSGIAIDPSNENHILVTYSNYGIVSVYETFNAQTSGTPTWTAVEGNLPDMPVRWVMFDPRSTAAAWVATEMGVWTTDLLNGTSTDWQPTNFNLSNARVDMLQYRSSDRLVAAGTHGRGFFTTIVPSGAVRINPDGSSPVDIVTPVPDNKNSGSIFGIADNIKRESASKKKVYLSGNQLLITVTDNAPQLMELYDQSGKLLKKTVFNGQYRQDVSGFAKGLYYVLVTNQQTKTSFTTKVYIP
jgi:hypothetical protein